MLVRGLDGALHGKHYFAIEGALMVHLMEHLTVHLMVNLSFRVSHSF